MHPTAPLQQAHVQHLTTAWSLPAWPPLLWQATGAEPAHFEHLGTRVTVTGKAHGPTAGQTVWIACAADGKAGMAWDWVQIARGVVALADPMSVITNVRLINEDGEVLTAVEAARYLNELVRMLPWQLEVQRALQAPCG